MHKWVVSRLEDMSTDESGLSTNAITSAFLEIGDYSNVLNDCADRDDIDSDYSPEDDTRYDGIMNWKQHESIPE